MDISEMDRNSEQNLREFRQAVEEALERLRVKGLSCDDSRLRNALQAEFEAALNVAVRTAFTKGREYEEKIKDLNTENEGLRKELVKQQSQRLNGVGTYIV